MKRKTLGLALGSGAIRGMVHVGVIKTLLKHNIPIDFIAGTSVGAWVGAHYALYKDLQKLEETTVGKTKEKLFALLEPSMGGGMVKGDKMEKLLADWLEDKEFKDLQIPFQAVATDLLSAKKIIFSEGKLTKALRASMSIPSFFKPVINQDKILVDGGLCDPVPVDVVKAMGADVVLAINLDNWETRSKLNQKNISLAKTTNRAMEVFRQHLAKLSTQTADLIIEPALDTELSSWKNYFYNNSGPKIMAIGEAETEKIIPELKKLLE